MTKTAQQSLMDLIFKMMPDLQDGKHGPMVFLIQKKSPINKKAVKTLMSLWDKDNLSSRRFKRPDDISKNELDLLISEKLIKENGSELEITDKGIEVIKTSILGDERSVFDDDGKLLDFDIALSNTKPTRRITKRAKIASRNDIDGNWYFRLKQQWG
jgi:hypothetical protein